MICAFFWEKCFRANSLIFCFCKINLLSIDVRSCNALLKACSVGSINTAPELPSISGKHPRLDEIVAKPDDDASRTTEAKPSG